MLGSVCAGILGGSFAIAGIGKLLDGRTSGLGVIASIPGVRFVSKVIEGRWWLLSTAEIAFGLLLFASNARVVLLVALVALGLYSSVAIVAVRVGNQHGCDCFGAFANEGHFLALARNAVLLLVGIIELLSPITSDRFPLGVENQLAGVSLVVIYLIAAGSFDALHWPSKRRARLGREALDTSFGRNS